MQSWPTGSKPNSLAVAQTCALTVAALCPIDLFLFLQGFAYFLCYQCGVKWRVCSQGLQAPQQVPLELSSINCSEGGLSSDAQHSDCSGPQAQIWVNKKKAAMLK